MTYSATMHALMLDEQEKRFCAMRDNMGLAIVNMMSDFILDYNLPTLFRTKSVEDYGDEKGGYVACAYDNGAINHRAVDKAIARWCALNCAGRVEVLFAGVEFEHFDDALLFYLRFKRKRNA